MGIVIALLVFGSNPGMKMTMMDGAWSVNIK